MGDLALEEVLQAARDADPRTRVPDWRNETAVRDGRYSTSSPSSSSSSSGPTNSIVTRTSSPYSSISP